MKEDIDTLKEIFATKEDLAKVERNLIDRIYGVERNLIDRLHGTDGRISSAKIQVIAAIVIAALLQPVLLIISKKMGL